MKRIGLLCIGLVLLFLSSASAELYRCRTPAGKLVVSDQLTNLPKDCLFVDEPVNKGSFNVLPSTQSDAVVDRASQAEAERAKAKADPAPWQNRAEALVESYKQSLQKRYHASFAADQRRAMQEIAELKQHKQQLLDGLPDSGLTRDEQRAIQKTLAEIPQN